MQLASCAVISIVATLSYFPMCILSYYAVRLPTPRLKAKELVHCKFKLLHLALYLTEIENPQGFLRRLVAT